MEAVIGLNHISRKNIDTVSQRIHETEIASPITKPDMDLNKLMVILGGVWLTNATGLRQKQPKMKLAQIFNVTTDELLGETSGLLHSAAKGELKQYTEENPVTMEELAEAAPLLLPNQTDEGFEKLTQDNPLPNLPEISNILPFIGKDLVDELVVKYVDSTERKSLHEIAPFASRQILEQIADRKAEAGEYGVIKECLPFLARETVVRLALKIYEKEGEREVGDFMPFLPQETRQAIAQREYKQNGMHGLEDLAPFLDRGYLTKLAREALDKDGIKAISPIAPFLDQEMITQFVREQYL